MKVSSKLEAMASVIGDEAQDESILNCPKLGAKVSFSIIGCLKWGCGYNVLERLIE